MTVVDEDVIDIFARTLPGVVADAPALPSDVALAERLGTDPRCLRELRRAGLIAPRRLGRGWIYFAEDIRRASVLVALLALGAEVSELPRALHRSDDTSPVARSRALLEAVQQRNTDRLAGARALERVQLTDTEVFSGADLAS